MTMRELIKAEERLMFSRHGQSRPLRKGPHESLTRQSETERWSRSRTLNRKELY